MARVVNAMTEFKPIIGRGTRVRDDYGKLFFNILDYTGSATKLFADPDFDGAPVATTPVAIDAGGEEINTPSCFLRAKSTILSSVANKGTTTDTGENGFID